MGFPGDSVVKNLPVNVGDEDSIPGLGRSPGGGHGNPLVSLPGEPHGQRSLAGHSPQGRRVRHDLATEQQLLFTEMRRMVLPLIIRNDLK